MLSNSCGSDSRGRNNGGGRIDWVDESFALLAFGFRCWIAGGEALWSTWHGAMESGTLSDRSLGGRWEGLIGMSGCLTLSAAMALGCGSLGSHVALAACKRVVKGDNGDMLASQSPPGLVLGTVDPPLALALQPVPPSGRLSPKRQALRALDAHRPSSSWRFSRPGFRQATRKFKTQR